MHAVVVYLSVRLSVCACVSVTLRYCVKTAKHRITQIMPHDRPGTLVFKWDVLYHSCRISTTSASRGPSAIAEPLVKYSYDNAKCKFYRAFNAVFGKVGRSASEEVIIQLLKTKCLPVLCCGLDVCRINRDQIRSLDYAIHSCFRKIFSRRDLSVIEQCMVFFDCHPVYDTVCEKKRDFYKKF